MEKWEESYNEAKKINEDDQKRWRIARHRQGPYPPKIQDLEKWVASTVMATTKAREDVSQQKVRSFR
jgi:hypothetical protein